MTDLIVKLKAYLDEARHFKNLRHDNHEWVLWRDKVRYLLDLHLGSDSEEKRMFQGYIGLPPNNPAYRQQYYLDAVKAYASDLTLIIQRLEMKVEFGQSAVPILEVTSTSLSFMHQKIQEVAGPLFADGYYAQAILEAFKAVNTEVERASGLKDKDGQGLMEAAFSVGNPKLQLNALVSQSEKDEQIGFMLLYKGAMQGIRNPKAHDNAPNPDKARTIEYLAFASLLMRRIDDAVSNAP